MKEKGKAELGPLKAKHGALIVGLRNIKDTESFGQYLPEEVVEEILLRLPPESLISFKGVCKLWYHLITNPSFVNKHLVLYNGTRSSISFFLKWNNQKDLSMNMPNNNFNGDQHEFLLTKLVLPMVTIFKDDIVGNGNGDGDGDCDNVPCVMQQLSLPPIPKSEQNDFPFFPALCHCNGIVCLYDRSLEKKIVVFSNPSLGKFKLLKTPSLPDHTAKGCGFGYDPRANVYKFVKVFGSAFGHQYRAQVYTLGVDTWRDVDFDYNIFSYKDGVYHNGVYYWWNATDYRSPILSFDMSKEKFRAISLPNEAERVHYTLKSLVVWNDSIVIFYNMASLVSFEMWRMVDNSTGGGGGGAYWTKHLKIGPLPSRCFCWPLAFWNDDELLIEDMDRRIVSYNLYTKRVRTLRIPAAVNPLRTHAFLCSKSLVFV